MVSRQRNLHLSNKLVLGTAQPVVSVTEGRPPKNLSEKKTDKNEVINNADNNDERNKRWNLLKGFLHDRTKNFYQQKPKLGKMGDEETKLNSKKNILGSEFIGKRTSMNFLTSFLDDKSKIIYQQKPRLGEKRNKEM